MTRVWSQTVAGQPHTHVLIVGVGAYRHLRRGADPRSGIPDMDLKQLTSPPISARKFADWVLREFNNPMEKRHQGKYGKFYPRSNERTKNF